MNIREIFKNDVSKSAFTNIDGAIRIVGKFGEIEIVGKYFDIYFVGPERTPLSGRRIKSLVRNPLLNGLLKELNGEAFLQTTSVEIARKTLHLLGVRKKRQISDEEKERLSQQMKNIRKD